jgi:hypothetical protein
MDLNKLTKKELVEYGESFWLSLDIREKKENLIFRIKEAEEQRELFEEVNDSLKRKNSSEQDSIQARSLKKKITHLEESLDSEKLTNASIVDNKERIKSDNKAGLVILGLFLLFFFYLSTLPSENI